MQNIKFISATSQFLAILVLAFYPVLVWAATLTDTTCAVGQFGSGTDSDTECSSNQVQLDATGLSNGSGNFTSRIMDAGASATWSSLGWSPESPYMKELPDSGGSDSGYSTGTIDMTDNVLLYHMNESSGDLSDSSSNSHTGTVTNATLGATGKLDDAVSFDGSGDYVLITDHDDFSVDTTGDMSVAFWLKTGGAVGTLQRVVQKGSILQSTAYFEWVIQISSSKLEVITLNGNGNNVRKESSSDNLTTNTWYHVVIVFTGTGTSDDIVMYLDGVDAGTSVTTYSGSMANRDGNLAIGAGYGGGSVRYLGGEVDEFAIFSDQVTAAEAWAMYKRGANRLKYQVRSCDDAACSGESFAGPDGTGSTYYSELTSAENGLPSKTLSNVDDNRYFQYKAYFETDNSSYTPELLDVTVTYSTGGGGGGVPEFSDGVYVATLLFLGYYAMRFVRLEQDRV